jgi:hypothetical protein
VGGSGLGCDGCAYYEEPCEVTARACPSLGLLLVDEWTTLNESPCITHRVWQTTARRVTERKTPMQKMPKSMQHRANQTLVNSGGCEHLLLCRVLCYYGTMHILDQAWLHFGWSGPGLWWSGPAGGPATRLEGFVASTAESSPEPSLPAPAQQSKSKPRHITSHHITHHHTTSSPCTAGQTRAIHRMHDRASSRADTIHKPQVWCPCPVQVLFRAPLLL